MKIVRERIVSPEAQTRTNEAKIAVLQQTLTYTNSFAQETTKQTCLDLSSSV